MRHQCRGSVILECFGLIIILCAMMFITFFVNTFDEDRKETLIPSTQISPPRSGQFVSEGAIPSSRLSNIGNSFHVNYLNENHTDTWMSNLIAKLDTVGSHMLRSNVQNKERLWKSVAPSLIMQNAHALSQSLSGDAFTNATSATGSQRRIKRHPPRALLYMGWVAFWNMEEYAANGGPQGEFVMWADLAAGLSAIGYDITFVNTIYGFWQVMRPMNGSEKVDFDIIVTDYDGLGTAEQVGDFPANHCRYYIMDFFGTDPEINSQKRNMDIKRFLTPYPYNGYNTFVSFIVGYLPKSEWTPRRWRNSTVLWAKEYAHYMNHKETIVQMLRYGDVHTFLMEENEKNIVEMLKDLLPSLVNTIDSRLKQHSYVDKEVYWRILSSSKLLLGVGLPWDGPTALEAIAHGCVFVNPTLPSPVVMKGHPNRRMYTSQHHYVEKYFAPPHSYTIDISNKTLLEDTAFKIFSSKSPDGFVHRWNTPEFYIENIQKVFSDQPRCEREVQAGTRKPPNKHPHNPLYNNFDHFVASNCGSVAGCTMTMAFRPRPKIDSVLLPP